MTTANDELTRDEKIMQNRDWFGVLMGWTPTQAARQLERCDDTELDEIAAIRTAPQWHRRQLAKAVLTRVAARQQLEQGRTGEDGSTPSVA